MELTPKIVCYLGSEEGLVPEAYKDGKGIWTWAMGLAATGGWPVLNYKDKPAPLDVCIKASIDGICKKYLPMVEKAFAGFQLTENQIAAALSFVWRNGTLKATWVADFRRGDLDAAALHWMNWTDHGSQVDRAKRERDLFFKAKWPDLTVPVYMVNRTTYKPSRRNPTDLMPLVQKIMGGL